MTSNRSWTKPQKKKQPPQREPMKQPKKTLADICEEKLKSISDTRREKQAAEKREQFRVLEDEVMAMTHGPDWRFRYAGESVPETRVPEPEDSGVQLKAS